MGLEFRLRSMFHVKLPSGGALGQNVRGYPGLIAKCPLLHLLATSEIPDAAHPSPGILTCQPIMCST